MKAGARSDRAAMTSAILTSFALIGGQIAAKATRDALFLTSWDITDLPLMLIAASFLSIAVVLLTAKTMVRLGPARLVPATFLLSSLALLGIWGLMYWSRPVAAIALYLHIAAFGVILISGFWSLVNERFDPHSAKKTVSRIVAGATFGGLVGGLLAERIAASAEVAVIMPVLAGLHLLCAWRVRGLFPSSPSMAAEAGMAEQTPGSALAILRRHSYLRNLAIVVLLGTVTAAILDYVYKVQATERFSQPEDLMRFFALYYAAIGLLTFLVQTLFSRRSLERLGLDRTVALLPLATAAGSIGVFLAPGLWSATGARLGEAVLHNSLFRSGYELFFVPIAQKEKRATKTIIDVGFDRMGDALGGGLIKAVLLLAPVATVSVLLGLAAIFSVAAFTIILYLRRGYVQALEQRLLERGATTEMVALVDPSTSTAILQTLTQLDLRGLSRLDLPVAAEASAAAAVVAEEPPAFSDPLAEKVSALHSGQAEAVRAVLAERAGIDPMLVAHVVPLLAWDEVSPQAVAALQKIAAKICGQLCDALLDSEEEFIIRRRIPLVLSACPSQRVATGLSQALSDKRFEVRYQAGKALAHILTQAAEISVDPKIIFEVIAAETSVSKHIWSDRRILDSAGTGSALPHFDKIIGARSQPSLEHLFTLLSMVLDRKPLKVAYRGLHATDAMLRGTALEYLDVILPAELKEKIWPLLGEAKISPRPDRDRHQVTQNLMIQSLMIDSNLRESL